MTDEIQGSDEETSFTMPSNPKERKEIKDALHEMCGALQFIEDKREYLKDSAAVLEEKFGIPKKISTKMARVLHKNTYSDVAQEADQFSTIFETLFQNDSAGGSVDDADED